MARQLTALGGAIFAGLFTVGIKQAGYKVLGHLEFGNYGVATARKNFPDLEIRVGPHTWEPERFTGKVDFMYTNPPCAAWSSMGRRDQGSGPRAWYEQTERLAYVRDLVQAGVIVQPRAWCWESVTGAWAQGREFVLEQARVWNQHGYHVTVLLQNNMYVGGTQYRKRMFLIAHKHPIVWQPFTEPRTLRQLFKEIPKRGLPKAPIPPADELLPMWVELWKRCDRHGRLRKAWEQMTTEDLARYENKRIPFAVCFRLRWDQPPPVMLESSKRFHPDEPRELTYHEWLKLCDLPWDWQSGPSSFNTFSVELARAVMPGVGEWLGRSIAAGIAKRPLSTARGVETRVVNFLDPQHPEEELLWRTTEFGKIQIPAWSPQTAPPAPSTRSGRVRSTLASPSKPPRAPRLGSGARIRELLQDPRRLTPEQIVSMIRAEFPQSKATTSDVAWQRNRMRKEQQRAA